jgi:TPR repeat protein
MTPHHTELFQPTDPDSSPRVRYMQALMRQDYDGALLPLRTAIAQSDARAMGLLGTLYMLGHGVARDEQEAYLWFRQGAIRADLPSQIALGLCLAGGRGTAVNHSEAVFWLYQSARAGATVAMEMLGWLISRHPELVGEHFTQAEVTAVVTPTQARPAGHRASGWAACLSTGHYPPAR